MRVSTCNELRKDTDCENRGASDACLSVAFERYVSICWGQSDSSLVTKKVRYYIFVILLISAIVDVPRFFELTPDIDEDGVDGLADDGDDHEDANHDNGDLGVPATTQAGAQSDTN